MNTLAFVLTLKCPLACSHCIVDSNPHRTERLAADVVMNLIKEAAALGVTTIGFTGGEPFLRRKELAQFHAIAKGLALNTIIITSAFFATTEAAALATLAPVSSVNVLGISTDTYHQQYTHRDNTLFAIRAAKQLGIAQIELQVTYGSISDLDATLMSLEPDVQDVAVRKQPLWPVGQARTLLRECSDILVPLELLDLTCPMVGPIVTPDKRVHGCCSSLLALGTDNPVLLGSLATERLQSIATSMSSHSHYQLLKRFGLRPLLTVLNAKGLSERLRHSYTDACHLCHHIHSEPLLRTAVSEALQPENHDGDV